VLHGLPLSQDYANIAPQITDLNVTYNVSERAPRPVEIRLKIEVTAGVKQRMMSSPSSRTVAIWVLSNRLRKSSWRGLKQTWQEIRRLNGARRSVETVPRTWDPDPKGRLALAQIIRLVSSREAGRTLGVSPRSADLHRAYLLKKLGQERR
jgi:hypothetical protein